MYANVMLALLERSETGKGREIDVSMLQAAASLLITVLPLIDFNCDPIEITCAGNEHRKFIPTNVYPAKDGFIYMAIGSDVQWKRLCELPNFASIAKPERVTNEGCARNREAIYSDIGAATAKMALAEGIADLKKGTIPNAQISDLNTVIGLEQLRDKLTTTVMPSGKKVRMQPQAVDREDARTALYFPHKYGTDTCAVLAEVGYAQGDIEALARDGVIAS